MTGLDTNLLTHHNANRRGVGSAAAIVTYESASECEAGAETPPEKQTPSGNARGVSCPIESFMSARQDMLRAWRRLQPAVSRAALREELRATTRAMRQLMELRE